MRFPFQGWLSCMLAALALLAPNPAEACTCREGPADLHESLVQARAGATAIYRARVTDRSPDWLPFLWWRRGSGSVDLEVLEVFKGEVRVGEHLSVRYGGHGDCTRTFAPEADYLVYATGTSAAEVWLCSRTRKIEPGDAELAYLRTGRLPAKPEAVQREEVTCTPCSADSVAKALVRGTGPTTSSGQWLHDADALKANLARRPFWTGGYYDRERPGLRRLVGRATDGRSFELAQTPGLETRETCRQRVVRRWCTDLVRVADPGSDRLVLKCSDPGQPEEVCDENQTRASKWGPLQALGTTRCDWRDPTTPLCKVDEAAVALPNQEQPGPRLLCRPEYDVTWALRCERLEPGASGSR